MIRLGQQYFSPSLFAIQERKTNQTPKVGIAIIISRNDQVLLVLSHPAGRLGQHLALRHGHLVNGIYAVGSRVFQYNVTRKKNLGVPVGNLHPLRELLERVKNWRA